MPIPPLIPSTGTLRDISPTLRGNPYTAGWWMTTSINRVPETAVGWLVAQGWQIVNTYEEDDVTYYQMTRESMKNWVILQALLEEYTAAYNEGRTANSIRYNDVIDLWNDLIKKSRYQLDETGDISDEHMVIVIEDLNSLMSDVENDVAAGKADMQDAADAAIAEMPGYLTRAKLIPGMYDTHAVTSRALLTDLGVTERARINEAYDVQLAAMRQELVNRGLYSSALVTQMTSRIERERNEQLTKLAEALVREQNANEHQLYVERIGAQTTTLDAISKYCGLQLQNGQFLTEVRLKLVQTNMQARAQKIAGQLDIRDREEKLMLMQLDTRNNLAVGLLGFVERREDTYPSMESMTKLVAGLGDAGGGWVAP